MTAPGSGNTFKSLFECGWVGEVTGLDALSVTPPLVSMAAWVLGGSGICCWVGAGGAPPAMEVHRDPQGSL